MLVVKASKELAKNEKKKFPKYLFKTLSKHWLNISMSQVKMVSV